MLMPYYFIILLFKGYFPNFRPTEIFSKVLQNYRT
jgi:hypothetical protein